MSRLRVGFITTSFPLWLGSTSGPFVAQLVQQLAQHVHVTVLTPCTNRLVESVDSGFKIHCFRYAPRRWQILAHLPGGIPAALRNYPMSWLLLPGFLLALFIAIWRLSCQVDVLHANWSVTGVLAGLVGFFSGTPVITTLRGEDFNRARKSLLFRYFLKFCLHLSWKISVVNEAIYYDLKSQYPAFSGKIFFLPNGVNEVFNRIPLMKSAESNSQVTLLYVGSLISRKGVDVLINSCAVINKKISWILNIIGDGPEHEYLKKIINSLQLENKINFLGSVSPDVVPDFLNSIDIY
jgi:glycosyltransferase involved in cell wall biosynthesis